MKIKKWFIYVFLGALLPVLAYSEVVSYFGKGAPDHVGFGMVTLLAGEDQTNDVIKTEQQFLVCIDDADVVCKASAGFLHSVWCYEEDGAPTAGTVRVTNTTTAGGAETTEVWGMNITTTVGSGTGHAVLDIVMDTGIVIDFTTTADVKCGVSYR